MTSDLPPSGPQRAAPKRLRDPQESRRALLDAAAEIFNTTGYFATDTNRIARAAGYAPGTFYAHFSDKLAIFLAVYENWVDEELRIVQAALAADDDKRPARLRLAEAVLAHHRRWRGFRASLRALYATDPTVRTARLQQRERQIAWNEQQLARDGRTPPLLRGRGARCMVVSLGLRTLLPHGSAHVGSRRAARPDRRRRIRAGAGAGRGLGQLRPARGGYPRRRRGARCAGLGCLGAAR